MPEKFSKKDNKWDIFERNLHDLNGGVPPFAFWFKMLTKKETLISNLFSGFLGLLLLYPVTNNTLFSKKGDSFAEELNQNHLQTSLTQFIHQSMQDLLLMDSKIKYEYFMF